MLINWVETKVYTSQEKKKKQQLKKTRSQVHREFSIRALQRV